MEVVALFLTGVGLSFLTIQDIMTSIKPYGDQVNAMCFHPANHDSEGNMRVVYTDLIQIVDRALCVVVNVFQSATHDVIGMPITGLLLAAFGTSIILMALEGTRKGYKRSLLSIFPIFAFLANIITATAMFVILWAPLSLYYKRRGIQKDFNITLAEVYGCTVGVLVAYGLPTLLLFTPLVSEGSRLEQDLWALWQFLPLFTIPVIPFCIRFFEQPSNIDRVSDHSLRERLYVAEGKDALEKVYLTLGIVNMLLYFGAYLTISLQGIHIIGSLALLLRAPGNLMSSISFEDMGQILSTRTMLIDFAAFSVGFLLWIFFDGGLRPGLITTLISPIIGPSAALSFYAYYRESNIQNLKEMNPPIEKPPVRQQQQQKATKKKTTKKEK
ncbi:hypothetical protein BY458DRAFT_505577 [Sporodiniella umbellata]|nr:hypothetical protein BY458DRAFT_505577 [Sporodiniella umbellata]